MTHESHESPIPRTQTGYIARHTAQRPHKTAEQLEHTKWTR